MGPELDKPTESKSSQILFRLKGAILELYSSSDWWPSNQKRDLTFYTKCSGINYTLYSRGLNSLGFQQFSLKKTAFHKNM